MDDPDRYISHNKPPSLDEAIEEAAAASEQYFTDGSLDIAKLSDEQLAALAAEDGPGLVERPVPQVVIEDREIGLKNFQSIFRDHDPRTMTYMLARYKSAPASRLRAICPSLCDYLGSLEPGEDLSDEKHAAVLAAYRLARCLVDEGDGERGWRAIHPGAATECPESMRQVGDNFLWS